MTIYLIIAILTSCFLLSKMIDMYCRTDENKRVQRQQQIEVLKIFTKNELFKDVVKQPENFNNWISNFLMLKGYRNIKITEKEEERDVVAFDKDNEVYINCELYKEDKWDKTINKSNVEQMIGQMVLKNIKSGLIVTSSNLDTDAKRYIKEIGEKGYSLSYIEGDTLISELYDLREVKLKSLQASLG